VRACGESFDVAQDLEVPEGHSDPLRTVYCLLPTVSEHYRYPTRPLTLVYRLATSSQLMIFMKLSTYSARRFWYFK
jgi:hypothetical protein